MTDWPHAPIHRLDESGAYMVTAGTYGKEHLFIRPERLAYLERSLLKLACQYGWNLQAWAVFSNHYHFIAISPEDPSSLKSFIRHLHSDTAREMNKLDGIPGRRVWFEYWDTHLTFEQSYYARLKYVHENALRHGIVRTAEAYPYCSAGWFEAKAESALVRKLATFKTDTVKVPDEYIPVL
jgi:putative transposase